MPASCAKAFSPTIALLGCGPKVMMRGEQLAAREKMLGHDAGFKRQQIAAGIQRHDDFFQRGVSGPLADAVDGALDLTCSALDRRQRIRHGQAQVVMAVYADHRRISQSLDDPRDQSAILFGDRKPYRVRKIHGPGAGSDYRARYLLQVIRIGPGGIFGRKFHVIAVFASEPHRGHGFVQNLLARFLQLVLQVNVAGGDEGMDARAPRVLERIGRRQDVAAVGSGQRRHAHPRKFARHRVHRFRIALRGDRKPGFENIHAQLHQLGRHAEFFRHGHAAARRLLPVT